MSDFLVECLESRSLKPIPKNRRQEKALLLFNRALGTIFKMRDGASAQEAHCKRLADAIKEHAALYFTSPETKIRKHTRSYAQDRTDPSLALHGDEPVNVHTSSLTPLPKGYNIDLLIKDKIVCADPTLGAYLHYWHGDKDKAENLEKTIQQYELDGRVILLHQL